MLSEIKFSMEGAGLSEFPLPGRYRSCFGDTATSNILQEMKIYTCEVCILILKLCNISLFNNIEFCRKLYFIKATGLCSSSN